MYDTRIVIITFLIKLLPIEKYCLTTYISWARKEHKQGYATHPLVADTDRKRAVVFFFSFQGTACSEKAHCKLHNMIEEINI